MRKVFFTAIAIIWFSSVASGTDINSLGARSVAYELGLMLGSEKGCGLSFDPGAIERFIAEHVDPNDAIFVSNLGSSTRAMERDMERFTPSQKTAHCMQIRRVAEANRLNR